MSGHDFSRAGKRNQSKDSSLRLQPLRDVQTSGAEARFEKHVLSAWLKPCPDENFLLPQRSIAKAPPEILEHPRSRALAASHDGLTLASRVRRAGRFPEYLRHVVR